ncbi:MAG: hypothetical protein QME28_07710 [Candidatus Saccharicenans sp.]|nr:hypothetical protein [Candidatus Saccharicenans sp.]
MRKGKGCVFNRVPYLSHGEAAGPEKFFSGGIPPVGLLPAGSFKSAAQSDPIIYSGQFALLYSVELALAVPIARGWKSILVFDKNGRPILIIFPAGKEESRDERITKYNNAIMINIVDNSAGETLERFVADELSATSLSFNYEAAYRSLTYRIKKEFSLEALERELTAINFRETGEVRKTGLKEAFPRLKRIRCLSLRDGPNLPGSAILILMRSARII